MDMNIFYLHRLRRKCAEYHCDKHVIKMILETAQLLCTAIWVYDSDNVHWDKDTKIFTYRGARVYRKTHENHPCAIWARSNKKNFRWLRKFGIILCKEYSYRYGKVHKTQTVLEALRTPSAIPDGDFFEPPQCMPDQYKVPGKCVNAYRKYYVSEKSSLHSWKGKVAGRNTPFWIKQ